MSRITHDICDWLRVPHHHARSSRREEALFGNAQGQMANDKVSAGEAVGYVSQNLVTLSTTTGERRLVLAGGSGYLGKLLKEHFEQRGWAVVVLTRSTDRLSKGLVHWDGRTVGPWAGCLEGADALINLAGRSVNCRYHAQNRREMMDSRILTTLILGEAMGHCKRSPKVWLNSSTATIYKHTFGPAWDESGKIGWTPEAMDKFSVEIATEWERVFDAAPATNTRRIKLRTAMVLSRDPDPNNAFTALHRLARFGLGGRMGSGKQFVSWIHEHDFCRALEFLIEHHDIEGAVNVGAPDPRPNAEIMRQFRKYSGMPIGLPAAKWMLEVGAFFLRTESELIIKSRRVIPGKLIHQGFQFDHENFEKALMNLMGKKAPL
jgi:uncharacterized protein (TIGR01777 family)